jgi:lipopolysaccharide biosynthesis glycosyltransferase/predicted O-methyltransferase YrrM
MSVSGADGVASESYIFTTSQDWFTHNIHIWEPYIDDLLSRLPVGRAPRALEVGSWEGRSAVYILTKLCNTPDSLLVCIDHFDLLRTAAGRERHAKVVHNLTLTGSPFRIVDESSIPGLMTLLNEEALANQDGGFDFVYIDGSHEADDTFLDAELAWRLTRSGGLIILDDYREPASSMHHPARGIDAFISLHEGEFELLHKEYQVILRKVVKMRIGFLHKSVSPNVSEWNPFEYGVYVAICVNSSFAMAGVVALRSAIEATSGRLTFYIIDCGLQPEEKYKLEASIPQARADEVTLMFHPLPPGSRGIRDPMWAKVDMLIHPSLLPVERILYLDADVLVRRDLKEIWKTDMGGKPIGAVRDIAFPIGHPGLPEVNRGRIYFNSGVLLVDLLLIRQRLPEMKNALATLQETLYKDQDFLNIFFPDFYQLDIVWNAGGLGTYASWSSDSWSSVDRDNTWPQGLATLLADPAIVHFVGPLHPSLTSVLDNSFQPWLGKPWGYSGAPGNPFTEHWWAMLEKTAWKGIRQDKAFKESLIIAKKAVVDDALAKFERRVTVQ